MCREIEQRRCRYVRGIASGSAYNEFGRIIESWRRRTSGFSCDASLKMTAASFEEAPGAPGGHRRFLATNSSSSIRCTCVNKRSYQKRRALTSKLRKRASGFHRLFKNSLHSSMTLEPTEEVFVALSPLREMAFLRRRPTVVAALDAPRIARPSLPAPAANLAAILGGIKK